MHHTENDFNTLIYKTLDYIHCNLSGDLSLEKVASVASYSPFHFQRLFKDFVGESPKQYIIRLRLEKAAHYLKMFPNLKMADISYDSGFSSLSTFSRAFKSYFGISPESYKNLSPEDLRKICKTDRKKSKLNTSFSAEFWRVNYAQMDYWNSDNGIEFTVKKAAEKNLLFVQTCLDTPDSITLAFRKLCRWAEPRGLITPTTQFVGQLLDIPLITPLEKCRYRACITVNAMLPGKRTPESMHIEAGSFASFELKGGIHSLVKSLLYFNHNWLTGSGYRLKEATELEVFTENPADKPVEQIKREVLIPIVPA